MHRVKTSGLAGEECFVLSCFWEEKGGGRERESPFFIILRCILICTSNAVSVMDDTQGKITAQKAKRGKRDPERIKNGPIVMLHPDQRLGAGKGWGGIPG